MEYIVETDNLTKRFPRKTAADHISMHIAKGDIYGFIGKNGAGKTTTMKLILGMLNPTEGSIKLWGDSNLDKHRRRIGSLIEAPGIYKNCSAFENMKRVALLSGGSNEEINEILDLVGLGEVKNRKAGSFSLGMKQRLGIAFALLGKPELLVLDEPINGLDPAGIKELRDCFVRLNKERGITILISSHILDELAKITTRYGIVNDGKLVEEVSAEELMERCKGNLRLEVDNVQKALDVLRNKGMLGKYEMKENVVYLYSDGLKASEVNKALVQNGIEVSGLAYSESGFEDYFIEKIGR